MNSTGTFDFIGFLDSLLKQKLCLSAQALPIDFTEINFWRDIFKLLKAATDNRLAYTLHE